MNSTIDWGAAVEMGFFAILLVAGITGWLNIDWIFWPIAIFFSLTPLWLGLYALGLWGYQKATGYGR